MMIFVAEKTKRLRPIVRTKPERRNMVEAMNGQTFVTVTGDAQAGVPFGATPDSIALFIARLPTAWKVSEEFYRAGAARKRRCESENRL